MKKEIWKDVDGYEGYYQISDLGNIKSLARVIKCRNSFRKLKERVLKPCVSSHGYLVVTFNKDGISKTFTIHQLIATCFLGHKNCGNNLVVDHVNNDPLDNRTSNLQIVSQRKNLSKDKKNKTSKYVGVSWYKNRNKWIAQIRINGKIKFLGHFTNELEASETYQANLKKLTITEI